MIFMCTQGEEIASNQVGSALILTINNPARRNALNATMCTNLTKKIEEAGRTPAIRSIILTGAGGHFCAGADLNEPQTSEQSAPNLLDIRDAIHNVHHLYRAIAAGPLPVIAAVQGNAFGMGMSLALACDFVIADSSAQFGAIFAKLGLFPDCGLLHSLKERVGIVKARQILSFGSILPAEDAFGCGMIDEIASTENIVQAALSRAAAYEDIAPASVAYIRMAFSREINSVEAIAAAELDLVPLLATGSDAQEALQAFRDKRPANFKIHHANQA